MQNIITIILEALGLAPTADKAVASITKAVTQLDKVAVSAAAQADRHNAAAGRALDAKDAAKARSARAAKLSANFSKLVS